MVLKQPVIQSLSKYEPVEAIESSASNGLRQAKIDKVQTTSICKTRTPSYKNQSLHFLSRD